LNTQLSDIRYYEIYIRDERVIGMEHPPMSAWTMRGFRSVWKTRRGSHVYVIVSNELHLEAQHAIYFSIAVEEGRVTRKTVELFGLGRYDN